MWIKFLYNYSLIISCYLDHLQVEIPSGPYSWHTNPECDQQMVRSVWHSLQHMLLPGEREKGKLQITYHWLCVCSYAHLKSLRQKLVCNKMLQILGLIYNSLKGNAVCGSWHLLCLNRGDIHMFIGVFILLCNPLSIQNALCSQNVYYFKSKGKITWANEKRRVMLQWIPSCSSFLKSTHCGELQILKKLFH